MSWPAPALRAKEPGPQPNTFEQVYLDQGRVYRLLGRSEKSLFYYGLLCNCCDKNWRYQLEHSCAQEQFGNYEKSLKFNHHALRLV